MFQNVLGQSDFRILKSAITQDQLVNQRDFLHADVDWRKIIQNFLNHVGSKTLSANQIEEFLNSTIYLKKDGVNQPYI